MRMTRRILRALPFAALMSLQPQPVFLMGWL
jgi:hypothetical protein